MGVMGAIGQMGTIVRSPLTVFQPTLKPGAEVSILTVRLGRRHDQDQRDEDGYPGSQCHLQDVRDWPQIISDNSVGQTDSFVMRWRHQRLGRKRDNGHLRTMGVAKFHNRS